MFGTMQTHSTPMAQTAAACRAELARAGRSQTWLATEVGENKYWVSRRLAGTTDISVDDVYRICAALNIPPGRVLPDSDEAAS